MSDDAPDRTRARGLWLVIAMVAALIAFAMWSVSQRTALVDDALAGEQRGATSIDWPDMRVDINRADVAELSLLPGVGERLAQRIIDDRSNRGLFANVDDLQRVPGMGAATIERLRAYAIASQR